VHKQNIMRHYQAWVIHENGIRLNTYRKKTVRKYNYNLKKNTINAMRQKIKRNHKHVKT